jgi:uncharacterized protein involved in exopolysaccharide biosynthesis
LLDDQFIEKKTMTISEDSISSSTSQSAVNTVEQFTLLDLLLVVVDNLRLLVLGPLLAGLLAFIWVSLAPKTYESTAILKANQATASLVNSASVLDPVASSLGLTKKLEVDDARLELKKQIQVRMNAKDNLLTLTTRSETPQGAQALAQAVLNQTYLNSQPRDSEKLRLQKQLEQALTREKQANQAAQILANNLDSNAGVSEVAQGYPQVMRVVQESQAAQIEIERQLNGLDSSALVQEPTVPTKHRATNSGLITVLVVQAAGFFLLIWVFVRNSLRNSRRSTTAAQKLDSLKASWRRAVGFSEKINKKTNESAKQNL